MIDLDVNNNLRCLVVNNNIQEKCKISFCDAIGINNIFRLCNFFFLCEYRIASFDLNHKTLFA